MRNVVPRGGLWRHADFLKLWTGDTISQFGSVISQLAIPLVAILILDATAFEVAALGTVEFAPFLLLTLPAGVWVDRLPRRLILIVADVVEQTSDKARRDFTLRDVDRSRHRFFQLIATEPRDQILAFVDCFGKFPELRTVAEVIRTHRQNDVDGQLALTRRFEKKFDEGGSFVPVFLILGRARKTKDLFKLIDDHQQVFVFRNDSLANSLDQTKASAL